MLRAFGHPVATCCDMLGVVGSNLTISKREPKTPKTSQHVAIFCFDMLRIVGLNLLTTGTLKAFLEVSLRGICDLDRSAPGNR